MRRNLYYTFVLLTLLFVSCRTSLPPKTPPLPTPSRVFGNATFKIKSQEVRIAVAPSGRSLAVVGDSEAKIIDLHTKQVVRNIKLLKSIWPNQVLFIDAEQSLMVLDDLNTAVVYPLDEEREATPLEVKVLHAEANSTGERLLLQLYSGTYLVEVEQLFRKRQERWQRAGDTAVFLSTGEIASTDKGLLSVGGRELALFSTPIGEIWPDPNGDALIVVSPTFLTEPDTKNRLIWVELKTGVTETFALPENVSKNQLRVLRGSLRFSAVVANFLMNNFRWENQGGFLHLFDLRQQTLKTISFPGNMPVEDIALSPNGKLLYVASPYLVREINLESARPRTPEQPGHLSAASRVDFSPDAKYFLSVADNDAILWNRETTEIEHSFTLDLPILDALLGESQLLLATPKNIQVFDRQTKELLWKHTFPMSPSKIAHGKENTVSVWLGEWKQEMYSFSFDTGLQKFHARIEDNPLSYNTLESHFSPDTSQLLILSVDSQIFLSKNDQRFLAGFLGNPRDLQWISIDHAGSAFPAVLDDNGVVFLLDPASGQLLGRTGAQRCVLRCSLALSRQKNHLAVVSVDGVRLWDIKTQEVVWSFLEEGIGAVQFSPDGQFLAFGRNNGEIVFFETP